MSNSRLTQHLLRGRVGFPTALASSVGLIMASPVILTATTGFGLGGGTFAVAMLVALLLMLAQSSSVGLIMASPVILTATTGRSTTTCRAASGASSRSPARCRPT